MVAVKKSPIHADLFPNAEHVEKADEKKPARRPSVDSGFAPSQGGQTRPGSPTAADTPDVRSLSRPSFDLLARFGVAAADWSLAGGC
jgi:hypothetical protein